MHLYTLKRVEIFQNTEAGEEKSEEMNHKSESYPWSPLFSLRIFCIVFYQIASKNRMKEKKGKEKKENEMKMGERLSDKI